jgi:alanine racemase
MNELPPATVSTLGGRLTVDLGAIRRNWAALDSISQGALTGAVVKADAYGLGIAEVGPALAAAGAQFFFTATLDEALALRNAVPGAHIFVLNGLLPRTAELYAQHRLMPCLASLPMLEEWLTLCVQRNEAIPAAFHFDTGMNRLGFRLNDATIIKRMIDQLGYEPQMIMSHLACADQPQHEKNRTQLALFQAVIAQFPEVPASLSNSAGMMIAREHHFQMVRPGIALYGGRAVNGRKNPMAPVVTLEAPVLQIKDAKTGESVGYGATQTLVRDSRLAILSLGYADGFFRSLSSSNSRPGGKVAWNGKLAPIAGRVSMDLVAVDITDLGDDIPVQGSLVEILGPTISVDDQAEWAGTIGYEVLTSLKGRYERQYVGLDPP